MHRFQNIPKSSNKEPTKVGSKFIEQLYSNQTNQNSLDVRWGDAQQTEVSFDFIAAVYFTHIKITVSKKRMLQNL